MCQNFYTSYLTVSILNLAIDSLFNYLSTLKSKSSPQVHPSDEAQLRLTNQYLASCWLRAEAYTKYKMKFLLYFHWLLTSFTIICLLKNQTSCALKQLQSGEWLIRIRSNKYSRLKSCLHGTASIKNAAENSTAWEIGGHMHSRENFVWLQWHLSEPQTAWIIWVAHS